MTDPLDPLLAACARADVDAVTTAEDNSISTQSLLFQRRADADAFHHAVNATGLDLEWDQAPWPASMGTWSRSVTIPAGAVPDVIAALDATSSADEDMEDADGNP